jgi:hypothetical protein
VLELRAVRRYLKRFFTAEQRRWANIQLRRMMQPLVAVRARRSSDLDALALYYGTDKSSSGHGYTRLYRRHLGPRRRAVRSVIEIGVGGMTSSDGYETTAGGQSLRMWSRYLPKAMIVGIDLHPKEVSGPRIRFEQGDQSDEAFLSLLVQKYGPFDLVIDDGSHIGRHITASFKALWPAVKPGGLYVIEDLQVAYRPHWEGGPPGTAGTAAELIKNLVDDTLFRAFDSFRPSIGAMHVYGEIVFLERRKRSAWEEETRPAR